MTMKKKKKRKSFHILLLFTIIIITMYQGSKLLPETERSKLSKVLPTPGITPTVSVSLNSLVELRSPHAIVMDLDRGELLLDKGSTERIYPASLTKIMTAIVAIEALEDYSQRILLSEDIFGKLYTANASMAGFLPGEEVPAIDLLYGVMLPSGAECCLGLAEYISGSEEDFVTLMNQMASELKLENTNFRNSTGLHDKNHYTTVSELARLLQYSLKNDLFRTIFTTERYSSSPTNKHPDGITLNSTMFKSLSDNTFPGGKLLGGKTGYTSKAGLCLASLAQIGDREYIMVSAGANGNHSTEQFNISDALTVYSCISDKQSLSVVSEE